MGMSMPEASNLRERLGWRGTLAALALASVVPGLGGLVAGGPWRWLVVVPLLLLAAAIVDLSRRHADRLKALAQAQEDYRQLVDLPAQAIWISDPAGQMLFISERWTEWTGQDLRSARTLWLQSVHPEDRPGLRKAWFDSLCDETGFDRVYRVQVRDGTYRWMRARAFPQRDVTGKMIRWIGQLEDVHEQRLAEEQLRHTAGLLEMIGNSTDSMIWAKDRDCRMLYINRALERVAGVTLGDIVGKTDEEWNPIPVEAAAFTAADHRVLGSGHADDVEELFTGHDGVARRYRSIRSPLRDRDGEVIGVVGVATDITEQRKAEEREHLLARELDHRAKNLLAVVQSVLALTRADTMEDFRRAIQGRIQALGRAHSMLAASRWEGADLHRIVGEELAPYAGTGGARIQLAGPALLLKPAAAQSLALVMHEFATNAVKYGALSAGGGTVQIDWELVTEIDKPPELRLVWTERGGPPVVVSTSAKRTGFGTRLIRGSIEGQLGGRLSVDWQEEGLVATLEIPVSRSLFQEVRTDEMMLAGEGTQTLSLDGEKRNPPAVHPVPPLQ
jgi:PAS domain S-box-containing protein